MQIPNMLGKVPGLFRKIVVRGEIKKRELSIKERVKAKHLKTSILFL